MFACLDMDCFFVSVQRIIHPELAKKPVIVGGHKRGVVAACSYEARAYGVHSGMASVIAKKKCPQATFVSGNHHLYSFYSKKTAAILSRFIPVIQQASIDEFYGEFTDMPVQTAQNESRDISVAPSPLAIMARIQHSILSELNLPCSIGIASSKTLAKIASKIGKPFGICYICPDEEAIFLKPYPVSIIPGIGPSFSRYLQQKGFCTISDLQVHSKETLTRIFGRSGEFLYYRSRGIGSTFMGTQSQAKSMAKDRTFEYDITAIDELLSRLYTLTTDLCLRLQEKQYNTCCVAIKIRYADFRTFTFQTHLSYTHSTPIIWEHIKRLLLHSLIKEAPVRLLGVCFSHLSRDLQLPLFPEL